MNKRKPARSVGSELVRRMRRFTESLETAADPTKRFTCRTIQLNLRPSRYDAAQVKAIRRSLRASQAIFAQFLGVSIGAVRDWEQGIKPPNGAACRLMDEIRQNPEYFLGRLQQLFSPVKT